MSVETGMVVRRGGTVMTPIVAVLTSPCGSSLPAPLRHDTAQRDCAVHSVLGHRGAGPKVSAEALLAVTAV